MKNLFGKILVGVAGCAMALSISAFAADVTIDSVDVARGADEKATGVVTVSGTITGDADSKEATILVVEKGVSIASVEDSQIRYIDQETAKEGKFTYNFKLDPGKEYDVWCGGTDITAPTSGAADLTDATAGSYKIIGTIKLSVATASLSNATATAGETTGTVDATTGAYAIVVANGKYNVVIGKPGYLYKTYANVEVADADKNLGEIELFAGDLDNSGLIDVSDIGKLLNDYEKTEFAATSDLNEDGKVDISDIGVLLNKYEKSYTAE